MSTPTPAQISNERLALLLRLSQDLNATLDPDEVLNRAMDDVLMVTHAERGFLMVAEDANVVQSASPLLAGLRLHVAHGIDQAAIVSGDFHVSRGIIQQVLNSGQPLLTSDALHDDRFASRTSIILHKLRSVMCVPLRVKQRVLGVIYTDNQLKAGIFSEEDLSLLTAIAANTAIALENARLYRQTEERLQALRLLHHVSQKITSTLELQSVLTGSTDAVRQLLSASAASIMIVEEDRLVFKVAVGEKADQIRPFSIPLDQGVAGWVLQQRCPAIVNDVNTDPRFYSLTDQQSGFSTHSLIAVPLVVNEKSLGVIEVFNKPGGFNQSDQETLATFATSVAFAIENARLYQVAIEKGRIERELQMAQRVQSGLLPQHMPDIPGWEFAAFWEPARLISGDYYDFIQLEKEPGSKQRWGLVMADVADKGMPAALFMAITRSTLRAAAYSAPAASEAVIHANALVSADSYNSMFVTLLYADLDPDSGQLNYVNAGHVPPLLARLQPDGSLQLEKFSRTGIPLGIDRASEYSQAQAELHPGDFLLLYTDGVFDALNPEEDRFGVERLEKLLLQQAGRSAQAIVDTINAQLTAFIRGRQPYDDITMMVVRRLP